MLFTGLAPLLKNRAVLFSVSDLGDGRLRVIVTPQALPLKKGETDENTALLTPLQLDGTAEELDAELPQHLGPFVESHNGLKSNLDEVKVIHAETAAVEKAAAAQKAAEAKNKNKNGAKSAAQQAEEKAAEKKAEAEKNKPPSLFGDTPASEPESSDPTPTSSSASVTDDDDETNEDEQVDDDATASEIEAEIAEEKAAAEAPTVIAEFSTMTTNDEEETIGDFTLRAA